MANTTPTAHLHSAFALNGINSAAMKVRFNSLPFIKTSKTVNRDNQSNSTSCSKQVTPHDDTSYAAAAVSEGQEPSFSTPNKRKRNRSFDFDLSSVKPCSLDELPTPSKLRKKGTSKSTPVKLTKTQMKTGHSITEHIATLKRKQNSKTIYLQSRPVVSERVSSNNHQEVPRSPNLDDMSLLDCFNQDSHSSILKPLSPTVLLEASATRDTNEIPLDGDDNPPINTMGFFPMSRFLTNSYTDFSHSSSDDVSSTDYVRPLLFRLPPLSPPSGAEPPFNPLTFGIKNLYPREE